MNLSYYWAANNGAGGEALEFHHPDRLGTRLVTNNAANTSFEQSTLPFGTAMPSESTGFSNQVFTSYDRSSIAGLDYAVNRTYSPGQGRFTTPDPIGMDSVSLSDPQSLNQFAYTRNSPTDLVDPSGLLLAAPDCKSTILLDFPDGENSRRFYVIVCVYESTGGGGAGYGIGHKVGQAQQQQQKPKCRQARTPEERTAVQEKLLEVAPPGSIGNIRPATDKNGNPTEGVVFDIYDVPAFRKALNDAGFDKSLIALNHLKQVNGNIFNSSERRSPTDGDGNIGPDSNSNGIVRSLQVVIGAARRPPGANRNDPKVATGYADLDCASPNQDLFGLGKHAGPIIGKKFVSFGRTIGSGFRKIGNGIKSIFGF